MASETGTTADSDRSPLDVVGVVADLGTYKNLLYLVLALPLGFVYWTFLMFGFTLGLVLSMVVVGLGILLVTVVVARLFARFERWLANVLLDAGIRPADDRERAEGIAATARSYVDAPSTWRGLGFLTLKFWFGILAVVLLAFLATAVHLLLAPLRYPFAVEFVTVNDRPVAWTIETFPEAALAVPVGLALGIALLWVTNAVAYVARRAARALLGATEPATGPASEP